MKSFVSRTGSPFKNFPVAFPVFWPVGALVFLVGGLVLMAQSAAPVEAWRLSVPAHVDSTPAVASDGTIYFGTFNRGLWAVTSGGKRKWSFRTPNEIWSSPAIGDDGTIYFGSRDRRLYAVTPEGKSRWTFATGAWVDSSAALGTNGLICFGSWDGNFYALNKHGEKLWQFKTGGPVVSSPAIDRSGTIYFGSHDGKFYAVMQDGKMKWDFATGGAIISSPALGEEGQVVFTSADGFLYVVNAGGQLLWKMHTGGVSGASPVLAEDGSIYLGVNRFFRALTPEGREKWDRGTDDIGATAALTRNGAVYFMYRAGCLAAYDCDRGHRWVHQGYPLGTASVALSATGTIYLLETGGWLRALQPADPSPLATGAWPKFRRNLRNTGNQADAVQ